MTGALTIQKQPHDWSHQSDGGGHCCYFCHPDCYDPMPNYQTMCARCGDLIQIKTIDPHNIAMEVCESCDEDLKSDSIEPSNTTTRKEGI